MKKVLFIATFIGITLLPSVSIASTLTQNQVNSIILLLQAFNVDPSIITSVYGELTNSDTSSVAISTSTPTQQPITIIINTPPPTPTSPSLPVFGSLPINDTPVPTTLNIQTNKAQGNYSYEWYFIEAKVLDQNGNIMHDQLVHMDNPSDNLYASVSGDFDKKTGSCTSPNCLDALKNNPSIAKDFVASFQYMSTTTGSHTITFTSGNLSTTTTVEVK